MPKVRKDNKGRNLRPGETQRSDGSYMFVYKLGKKKKYIYDFDLASLRAKEKVLNRDSEDGIRTQEAMKITLNDMFKVLMDTKIQFKTECVCASLVQSLCDMVRVVTVNRFEVKCDLCVKCKCTHKFYCH